MVAKSKRPTKGRARLSERATVARAGGGAGGNTPGALPLRH